MRLLCFLVCGVLLFLTEALGAFAQSPPEVEIRADLDKWRALPLSGARQTLQEKLIGELIDFGNTESQEDESKAVDMADEIVREGAPKNELIPAAAAHSLTLHVLSVLKGTHQDENTYPKISPVFRKISPNRLEAWDPREGWLFNSKGKLLVHVRVPRRDGTGREWYGAFLPNGRWITTDLWENDRQLNCFNPGGEWLWELQASRILAAAPPPIEPNSNMPLEVTPSIGWARADRTGNRWLVGLGTESDRSFAFILPGGKVQPVPENTSLWSLVEPRSMGIRGFFVDLYIDSDDGKVTLDRSCPGHGKGVPWPNYTPGGTIYEGDDNFGFWPRSHAFYIETNRGPEKPREVWFFDEKSKYEGQAPGSFLGDGAKLGSLLIQRDEGVVFEVALTPAGLEIGTVRRFQWPDGSVAVPLAIYDNWKIGFFLRPSGAEKSDDSPEERHAKAEVILAGWIE